jgi:A/G-specific adenine glycosylase
MKQHRPRIRFGHRTVKAEKIDFFRRSLLAWWRGSERQFPWRERQASTYHQVVSETLLQRTRAETVAAFWPSFISRFPSWRALAEASTDEVEEMLRPIGMAKQRAPRLHALAKIMRDRKGRFSCRREELESLPGVGQYIASAILTFCHDKPQPLLDVNMARVIERFFGPRELSDIRYDPYLQNIAGNIIQHAKGKALNWAILDFSALLCKRQKPLCEKCPIVQFCNYAKRTHRTRPSQSPH